MLLCIADKNPSMFTDITQGNNPGCNTNGFYAAEGWDPVTGTFSSMSPMIAGCVVLLACVLVGDDRPGHSQLREDEGGDYGPAMSTLSTLLTLSEPVAGACLADTALVAVAR